MGKALIKRFKVALFPLVSAFILTIILYFAAIAKIVYPSDIIAKFAFPVAIFEIVLASALLIFFYMKEIWVITALVFASWEGYSLFWLIRGLPCECMGKLITIPPGISIAANIVIFAVSLYLASALGVKKKQIKSLLFYSIFAVLFGVIIAYSVFSVYFNF